METKKTRLRWNKRETIKYCSFIKENEKILSMPLKRQKQKIYNEMQSFIQSRTKEQCKSHHQKMLHKYKSISKILSNHMDILQGTLIM